MHIGSEEGKQAIAFLREINGFDDDWLPNTMDPSMALHELIAANRAHVVRQHGGMGKGATRDLEFLVSAELEYRRAPQDADKSAPFAAQEGTRVIDKGDIDSEQLPPAPKTPTKVQVPMPDKDGIQYPTPERYHSMKSSEKSKITKRINSQRLEKGLEKWTPPAKEVHADASTPTRRQKDAQSSGKKGELAEPSTKKDPTPKSARGALKNLMRRNSWILLPNTVPKKMS